ncbi:MAG: 30S ribosomal protein S18 [Alkaliphilus sp.]|nr:MAG: 30S ribosomal protein S18 [Alkaliphilus sp.]
MINARRKRKGRKKICIFCADKNAKINYKDTHRLKKFITERGKILPRRVSGNCAIHQRDVTQEIKKSRHVALMPYSID